MYEILRLIRIRTIAFAALTMYAMRYLVIGRCWISMDWLYK